MTKGRITDAGNNVLSEYSLEPSQLSDCKIFKFEPGEFILRQDTSMESLFLLMNGTAKVCINARNGKNLILCYYVSQGILGDIEMMLDNLKASTSVISVTKTTLIGIPYFHNTTCMKQNVQFMNLIAKNLSLKLLRSSDAHVASALFTSEERLCSYICMTEHNGIFSEVLTDVAQSVGMSYRHVFRVINRLCNDGILEKTDSGYRILDRERLVQKASWV